MAEAGTTPFVMHGARDAMAGGLAHIERHIIAIESAVVEEPALAFDLAKTLIEAVCKAVLDQRTVGYTKDDDLPKLFKSATQNLPFLPSTASDAAKVRESLKKTLGGLSGAVQGICELRNECGFASHGSGEARPVMEAVQALLAAEAADAVVGFLHRVHRQDRTPPPFSGPKYEDGGAFNATLDDEIGPIQIREATFSASEVLFRMEPETYRIYLAEFDGADADAAAPAEEEVQP
jgi:hypothetical protein